MSLIDFNKKIEFPYTISAEDLRVLRKHPVNLGNDWKSSKYKKIKERIKDHYSIVQDDICPYCRTDLRRGGYSEPIEHIVPKDDYPYWMFEPLNLALSCYGCNTKKNAKETLSDPELPDTSPYPILPKDFKIVHPHFDIYSNEIVLKHSFFYFGIKAKGIHTVEICDLNRIDLLFYKARQTGLMEDDSIHDYLLKIQSLPGIEPQIVEHVILMIKDIKRRFDYKNKIKFI